MRGRKVNMEKSILIIAGSDSCAGAGAQIDLKTAAAHGVYATCALTAVTAQNTRAVTAIQLVDPDVVVAQVRAVFDDMRPRAVKVGMLGSAAIAQAVAAELAGHRDVPVVLDPVLVATAGGTLTEADALEVIRGPLLAQAALVTPNVPEAEALSGIEPFDAASTGRCAAALLSRGARAVLVKGGHFPEGAGADADEGLVVDRLYTAGGMRKLKSPRLPGEFHGTGCSLSTAIACNLALGKPLEEAVEAAHSYLADALRHPLDLGSGTRVFDPLNRLDAPYGA